MMNIAEEALKIHEKFQGKLEVRSSIPVKSREELSLLYTPGVAEPCKVIAKDVERSFDLTWRGRCVAVVSDGSAVLGLGNIGPEAAMPVMEGKSLLMKEFGGVDSIPLVIKTQDTGEIIKFVKQIVPSFAGINLEDIAAPRCFEVEEALQDVGIPVFHDDQHGTSIVVGAALINAAEVVDKKYSDLKVAVIGAGAAGQAVTKMLLGLDCKDKVCVLDPRISRVADVVLVDSKGIIHKDRSDIDVYKQALVAHVNKEDKRGSALDAVTGADVVIGLSGPGTITEEMVSKMADKAIVFAMANPTPEIMPELAKSAGAMVVATGRSDFPNQINNVLAFPAIFRAVIDGRLKKITLVHKQAAMLALADMVQNPNAENIIPDPFTENLASKIAVKILEAKGE